MLKRLQKELTEMLTSPPGNCSADTINDDLTKWQAIIFGPEGTPYESGTFSLTLDFAKDYPFKPPIVKFQTRIYHPNISLDGHVCLDILKDQWSPVLTPAKILLSLCSLLGEANASDPLNSEAGALYKSNRAQFNKIAKDYTIKYAN